MRFSKLDAPRSSPSQWPEICLEIPIALAAGLSLMIASLGCAQHPIGSSFGGGSLGIEIASQEPGVLSWSGLIEGLGQDNLPGDDFYLSEVVDGSVLLDTSGSYDHVTIYAHMYLEPGTQPTNSVCGTSLDEMHFQAEFMGEFEEMIGGGTSQWSENDATNFRIKFNGDDGSTSCKIEVTEQDIPAEATFEIPEVIEGNLLVEDLVWSVSDGSPDDAMTPTDLTVSWSFDEDVRRDLYSVGKR